MPRWASNWPKKEQTMINIVFLGIIILVGLAIQSYSSLDIFNNATYALGLILLSGYVAGNLAKRIKFPSITGCILVGILVGPYGLSLITLKNVADLQLLNGLALSIIALTAGGELNFSRLRGNFRTIHFVLIFQTLIMIIGITLFILLLRGLIPAFAVLNIKAAVAAGLLLGIISSASSPSTTLAVIVETRIRNRLTEIVLSIVMLKDIVILFLFVIGLNISRTLVGGSVFDQGKIVTTFLEIGGSLLSGVIIGLIIVLYLKFVKKDTVVFILALSFFSYEIFKPLHLHPLLVMMVAGLVVENFSREGDRLMKHLESLSPPIYVLFFTLAGAAVNLAYLKNMWLITIVIVLVRILLKYAGTWAGGTLIGECRLVCRRMWMSFISQAGLSLGMAKIIEANFQNFGQSLAVLIISVIVINQIIGPLLLKLFLTQSNRS